MVKRGNRPIAQSRHFRLRHAVDKPKQTDPPGGRGWVVKRFVVGVDATLLAYIDAQRVRLQARTDAEVLYRLLREHTLCKARIAALEARVKALSVRMVATPKRRKPRRS